MCCYIYLYIRNSQNRKYFRKYEKVGVLLVEYFNERKIESKIYFISYCFSKIICSMV